MSRVRHVCRPDKCVLLPAGLLLIGLSVLPIRALAGFDTSGQLDFEFLAEGKVVYRDLDSVPGDAPFSPAQTEAYFHTQASTFPHGGFFMWADFELDAPDGIRHALLMIDVDLGKLAAEGQAFAPSTFLKAEYAEKRGDEILFWGKAQSGDLWINDLFLGDGDRDAVDGGFALVFYDPDGRYPGCRIITRAHFFTRPTPVSRRSEVETGDYDDEDVGDNDYYEEESGGCGGEEAEVAAGCAEVGGEILVEGCAAAAASGCEGDTGDGSGCEGDTYEEASLISSRRLTRILPQLGVVLLIFRLRRRKCTRNGRQDGAKKT